MPKVITDKQKIHELLTRGVEEAIIKENLEKELSSGRQLRIKLGIDPTGSELHIGHAVVLRKLREFQDLGHQVIFLIGDFTARIGDPTGRSETRKPLSDEQIKNNMKDYINQANLILDKDKVEIRYNSEWLAGMDLREIIILTSKATYAQMAQRADFKERIKNDIDLSLLEFMYPVMQGYDSVALKADVELGGTDQKFNLLTGRQIQKKYGQKEQNIMTVPLLEGLDGSDKMSKSLKNYIGFTERPEDMFGKVMSIPDGLLVKYYTLCTRVPMAEVNQIAYDLKHDKVNPRDIKARLAREIIKIYHDEKAAEQAEEHFKKVFQKHEAPDEIKSVTVKGGKYKAADLFVEAGLCSSKGEAKRLTRQNGLYVDGAAVADAEQEVEVGAGGVLLKKGKRFFRRVVSG